MAIAAEVVLRSKKKKDHPIAAEEYIICITQYIHHGHEIEQFNLYIICIIYCT